MASRLSAKSRRRAAFVFLFAATWIGTVNICQRQAHAEGQVCDVLSSLVGCGPCSGTGEAKDDDEDKKSYGPCPCQERKTLMQWSYGTSFGGGPPGMDEPLEADRPGITVSPLTVGRGVVQLETGYMYTLDHNAGDRHVDHAFPDTLWRIGMLAEWFEFRIEYNYEIINNTFSNGLLPATHQHISGSDDLELGARFCLTPQEGILPAMGITVQMSVPSGSPALTEGQVMPGFLWAYSWEINKRLSLTGLTEIERARDDDLNIFSQFTEALNLQYQLTKKLACYGEWFVFAPDGHSTEATQHYFDGGFAYHVTNNLQLDIEAGLGLNAAAEDFFAGAGAVVRY